MRVIISGGREEHLTFKGARHLIKRLRELGAEEIVQGGAHGIDTCAELLAHLIGMKQTKFPAKWDKHGRSAGYLRNAEMAEYGDILISFKGGVGTANMREQMNARKKRVITLEDHRFTTQNAKQGILFNKEAIGKIKCL